jgi:hypothetical protein
VEDFFKPKIIFQEIVQESQFMLDEHKYFFCNDTCRIIVGKDIRFLMAVMNSKLFFFCIKQYYGGGALGESGVRMKHSFFQKFPCIPYNHAIEQTANDLSDSYSDKSSHLLDEMIYGEYNLDKEEIEFIESQCNQ